MYYNYLMQWQDNKTKKYWTKAILSFPSFLSIFDGPRIRLTQWDTIQSYVQLLFSFQIVKANKMSSLD